MYNSIILSACLSACLFGSIYIFSKSLQLINISLLKNIKVPHKLIILNSLTLLISVFVFVFVYSLYLSN